MCNMTALVIYQSHCRPPTLVISREYFSSTFRVPSHLKSKKFFESYRFVLRPLNVAATLDGWRFSALAKKK